MTVLGADCWYVGVQADGTAPEDKVTFCQECGNNVHVECFKRWTASKKGSGEPVTCVYCRCPWVVESGIATPTSGATACYLWHAIWQHSSFAYTHIYYCKGLLGSCNVFPNCGGQPSSVCILPNFNANMVKSVPDGYGVADVLSLSVCTVAGGSSASLNKDYVNLRNVSHEHQNADTSLHSLYGDTAVWIQAHNGRMGRRQAANLWRLSQAM